MLSKMGFLSTEIMTSLQQYTAQYGEPIADVDKANVELERLSYDFNALAMRVAFLPYPLRCLSDFFVGVLFARLVQDYQAVILLASRGMRAQSRTMARVALETMFHCLAASENIELKKGRISPVPYIDAVLSAHDSYRLRQSKHLLQSEFLSAEIKAEIEQVVDELRAARPVSINLENLAEDLGRTDWYSRYYRRLSQDSHPSVIAIEHHIHAVGDDKPVTAQFGQNYDEFGDTVTIAILVLFEALRSIRDKQLPKAMAELIETDALPLLERLAAHVETQ